MGSVIRHDAWDKCRGKAGYMDELSFPGMLHGIAVRSPFPRARIRSIAVPELPAGYYIIDRNDIPGKNICTILRQDFPVLAEGTVSFAGQAILLVAGPERARLLDIRDRIKIDYEIENPVITLEDADFDRRDAVIRLAAHFLTTVLAR